MSAHRFTFPGLTGATVNLADYKGKAVLVVNVASRCGLTPQYEGLQKLWGEKGKKGLVVLGVPSNDFGAQEPGSETEIQSFCSTNYSVDFPMTGKQTVIGGTAHPFYRWLVEEAGEAAAPKWNFHKVLIGKNGELAGIFGSRTDPADKDLAAAIDSALKA